MPMYEMDMEKVDEVQLDNLWNWISLPLLVLFWIATTMSSKDHLKYYLSSLVTPITGAVFAKIAVYFCQNWTSSLEAASDVFYLVTLIVFFVSTPLFLATTRFRYQGKQGSIAALVPYMIALLTILALVCIYKSNEHNELTGFVQNFILVAGFIVTLALLVRLMCSSDAKSIYNSSSPTRGCTWMIIYLVVLSPSFHVLLFFHLFDNIWDLSSYSITLKIVQLSLPVVCTFPAFLLLPPYRNCLLCGCKGSKQIFEDSNKVAPIDRHLPIPMEIIPHRTPPDTEIPEFASDFVHPFPYGAYESTPMVVAHAILVDAIPSKECLSRPCSSMSKKSSSTGSVKSTVIEKQEHVSTHVLYRHMSQPEITQTSPLPAPLKHSMSTITVLNYHHDEDNPDSDEITEPQPRPPVTVIVGEIEM